ncbi:beta-galactosidase, partial [Paenibacillus sp. MCAF20]
MTVLSVQNDHFYFDNKPIRLLSGAIHYFRVVPEYWQDRLSKLKACGFNTVETY